MYFLFYGTDFYRSKRQLNKFIAEFKTRRDPQGYNTVILSGGSVSLDEILGQCVIAPFLGEKRLVVVNSISENKNEAVLDELYKRLKDVGIPEYVVLVFWEKQNFDKKAHLLFSLLTKEKYSQVFEPLENTRLAEWVCAQAENGGMRFDKSAAVLLIELLGSDLGVLDLETQKLIAWARGEKKKIITKEDIHTLIPSALDDEVFHFIDALFQGNTKQALRLLYDQRASGSSEQDVFGALLWQIRTLLELKDFVVRNPYASSADCARQLGIHPFVIKKTGILLSRVSMQFLSSVHEYFLRVDKDIKTGVRAASFAFDQLVFDITRMIQRK
ncbi:MAG: polymerase III, delta subunit protein [Candidatus Magasanikbacteria bacterium GW2011_GWC2_45_8]|uniref:DNA polymerase III subunit delta n=1 Tax=Candidatus Magasanikbacteria bacterium GW2011_GWC2_45_8 TaxID=1619050 RepID=A0A0G1N089_9BACT|nr:MAG: polymerase III, delta subunit protein [Candidatus Magasanikbacteria bacterium GW2011_GWC2_45_8]HBW73833.1 DNA polymerase III subunit delta [Candidatus Magasanikbacteria bacterium]